MAYGSNKIKKPKNGLKIYIKFQNLLFCSTSLFSGKTPPPQKKAL